MGFAYGSDSPQRSIDRRIAQLAASQHGVFTRAQALGRSATKSTIRRRLEAGRWEEIHPAVYRIAGNPRSWRQELMAACYAWGEGTFVSHRAAAALWRMAGLENTIVEITVPRDRRRKTNVKFMHWMRPLSSAETTVIDAIPVTNPTRTLFDVAADLSERQLELALDDAVRRKLTSLSRMRWYLVSADTRPGVRTLRSVLDARDRSGEVPQSVLETRLLRLLKEAGLPKPLLQHQIRDGAKLVAVVDFAFPSIRMAIEADGYRWHSGRLRWEHDLARRNVLTSMGWRVLHITWNDLVHRPQSVIHTVERAARAAQRANEVP